jgi:class 3 adenylate cyclase
LVGLWEGIRHRRRRERCTESGGYREQGTDILITDDLARTIDRRFVLAQLPPLVLRGIDKPVQLHAVHGFER